MIKYFQFIRCFFRFLGSQNDYLFPFEGQHEPHGCPYNKPHWYKTRIGFDTAFNLAKTIWL